VILAVLASDFKDGSGCVGAPTALLDLFYPWLRFAVSTENLCICIVHVMYIIDFYWQ